MFVVWRNKLRGYGLFVAWRNKLRGYGYCSVCMAQ